MSIWFTSDTHFGHENIIKHCKRPFSSIEEMDLAIICNINNVVKENDTLFHLGDFAWNNRVKEFRDKIRCKNIYCAKGNHDDKAELIDVFGKDNVFDIYDFVYVKSNIKQYYILCHYPIAVWNKSHYGSIHCFGHCHANYRPPEHSFSLDVGVDAWAYAPISIDQVNEYINRKQKMMYKKLRIDYEDEWIE